MRFDTKDIIIALMLLVGVLFTVIPNWGLVEHTRFPLMTFCYEWQLKYQYPIFEKMYWFLLFEHILVLCYCYLLILESKGHERYWVFSVIALYHFVDFVLTYNLTYTWIWIFPISANTLGFMFFSVYLYDKYAIRRFS